LVLDETACCRLEGDYLAKPLAARGERSMLWLGDAARVDFAYDVKRALELLDVFHYDELIVACGDSLSGEFWDSIRERRRAQRLPVTVI
jgi:hypothetical protein